MNIVFTLDRWQDRLQWKRAQRSIKEALPDDWTISFRPQSLSLTNADAIARWIQEETKDGLRIPAKITIGFLEKRALATLLDRIRSRDWGRQDLCLAVHIRDNDDVREPPPGSVLSRYLKDMLIAWSGIPTKLHIVGLVFNAGTILHPSRYFASYSQVSLELAPSLWLTTSPSRHLTLPTTGTTRSLTFPAWTDFHLDLPAYPSHFEATTDFSRDAVGIMTQDRIWIRDLARALLAVAGPLGRHTVTVGPEEYWRPPAPKRPNNHVSHVHVDDLISDLLNNTISTIIECQAQIVPPGYRKL